MSTVASPVSDSSTTDSTAASPIHCFVRDRIKWRPLTKKLMNKLIYISHKSISVVIVMKWLAFITMFSVCFVSIRNCRRFVLTGYFHIYIIKKFWHHHSLCHIIMRLFCGNHSVHEIYFIGCWQHGGLAKVPSYWSCCSTAGLYQLIFDNQLIFNIPRKISW